MKVRQYSYPICLAYFALNYKPINFIYLPFTFRYIGSRNVVEEACVMTFNELIGPRREKTCLWGFANDTGADQPAHPRSLISAFVIRYLESIISTLATSEISSF